MKVPVRAGSARTQRLKDPLPQIQAKNSNGEALIYITKRSEADQGVPLDEDASKHDVPVKRDERAGSDGKETQGHHNIKK